MRLYQSGDGEEYNPIDGRERVKGETIENSDYVEADLRLEPKEKLDNIIRFKSMKQTCDSLKDAIVQKAYAETQGVEYPTWICRDCALKSGAKPGNSVVTCHQNNCGWCGEVKSVCHVRNWGYPAYDK